jgi:hypothetical protein
MAHILEALQAMHTGFKANDSCTPGEASKYRGVGGFASTAEYGNLLKAAMGPFKQRQYSDVAPWRLSRTMERAIEYIDMVIKVKPVRRMYAVPSDLPPLVVASDAQVEAGSPPGGGALLFDPVDGARIGFWTVFDDTILASWGLSQEAIDAGRQPIALCEGAMVPFAVAYWRHRMRGRKVVWYLDNTSSLHSFIKGTAGNAHMEKIVNYHAMMAYHLQAEVWFEWVESKANWADGISRLFGADPFVAANGFTVAAARPDVSWANEAWSQLWYRAEAMTSSDEEQRW